jgi:hypothetical protein
LECGNLLPLLKQANAEWQMSETPDDKLKSFLQNSVLARPAVRYAVKQQNVEFVQPVCWFVFTI